MVNIMLQIYRQHMIYDKCSPVLYVNLNNPLYGCLVSAFLFDKRIMVDMRGTRFELNPYNPCVEINDFRQVNDSLLVCGILEVVICGT